MRSTRVSPVKVSIATSEMQMPAGAYHILNPEGATRGGAMKGQHPGAPSMWLAWIEVDDVDATLGRVAGPFAGPVRQ